MKSWLKNAVFYEIYPQSFNDTNADGIGDFKGIAEKLNYLKDMGFTAIWLNPCFDSPFNDAGYDIRDFYKTADRYGSNEDLKALFDEVHKKGMHIILDLVPGHTSIEHKWFLESKKPEKNEYSDRYIWTDSIWTNLSDVSGICGSLIGISERNGICGVNFFSSQPALNYGYAKINAPWQCSVDSEAATATRDEMLNIMRFWLKMGCDGFRVDMAHSLVKNDEGEKETINLWKKIFAVIKKEFPDSVFISEWGNPEKAISGGFDMDFLLTTGPSGYRGMFHHTESYFSQNGETFAKKFFEYYVDTLKKTEGKGYMCIPSGNHDMERISRFCNETQIKLVYAFIMSMPGIPFIYYGDEIGMKYLPDVVSVEGGYGRTGSRTPMQWDDSVNCGFSLAPPDKLYIMQDPDSDRPTVEKQMNDKNSVLNELKKQIAVRKEYEVLQENAGFELISCEYPLIYKRCTDDCVFCVAINPVDKKYEVEMTGAEEVKTIYSLNEKAHISDEKVVVPPLSATYIEILEK